MSLKIMFSRWEVNISKARGRKMHLPTPCFTVLFEKVFLYFYSAILKGTIDSGAITLKVKVSVMKKLTSVFV